MSGPNHTLIAGVAVVLSAWALVSFRRYNQDRAMKRFLQPNLVFEVWAASEPSIGRVVLLTGGLGFLGRNILQQLIEDPDIHVIVLDILLPRLEDRKPRVTYIRANILNQDHLERIFNSYKIDSVLHVASILPLLGIPEAAIQAVNVEGARKIVSTSQRHGARSLVYTSSATVVLTYQDRNSRRLTEDVPIPAKNIDVYTTTKAAAEKIVLGANDPTGLVTCVLRPAGIFGEGDRQLSDTSKRGIDAFLIGPPGVLIDFVPVECVAHAHVLAEQALQREPSRARLAGQVYNIGNDEEVSFGEFFGHQTQGRRNPTLSHWEHPPPAILPMRLIDVLATVNEAINELLGVQVLGASLCHSLTDFTRRSYTFSSAKAAEHFGYKPLFSVREGIHRLVDRHLASQALLKKD